MPPQETSSGWAESKIWKKFKTRCEPDVQAKLVFVGVTARHFICLSQPSLERALGVLGDA